MTRLLVIEDEAPLLEIILTMLRYTGFDVVGALDGEAGVGLARTYQPDLVISDIQMPEMDGYGVLQTLRADPATAAVPFIFLTARVAHDDIRYGMGMGADDYLTKPFTNEELLEAIETRLARHAHYNDLQQQLAEVSKAEQIKTDMIRLAAHDLRNPINATKLALSVLKRKYAGGIERIEEFHQIAAAATQMESITTDILSLERVHKAVQDNIMQPVNLAALVERVYLLAAPQAEAKNLQMECEIASAGVSVLADPAQLKEAFQNLVSNAIKYTPAGGSIMIRVDRKGSMLHLTVEDNGYGVPDEQMGHLFQPFFRAETPEVQEIPGFGLGLNLVKNIVERHQGRMIAESVYGEGSVFGFSLPIHGLPTADGLPPEYPMQMGRPGVVRRLIGHIISL